MFVYMVERDRRSRTLLGLSERKLRDMLSRALENHDDFVLAWEPRPGEEPGPGTQPVVHLMTGNLITSCRLNALRGRVQVFEDEGARIVTVPVTVVQATRSSSPTRRKRSGQIAGEKRPRCP